MLYRDMQWAGINTDCITKIPGVLSGCGFCMISQDSQNSIIIIEGANAGVSPEYVAGAQGYGLRAASIVMCEFMITPGDMRVYR